jgi:hypothetical protein
MKTFDLKDIQSKTQEDIDAIQNWCDELYDTLFNEYFEDTRNLFERLKSKSRPITDEELSDILTLTPLNLFTVSENLNRLRLNQEVVKLRNKQLASEIENNLTDHKLTTKERQEIIDNTMIGDKLLLTAYNVVITRVENEISFSRELIMSAKKLWDARKKTECVNPVSPTNAGEELPEYKSVTNRDSTTKTYITS